MLRKIQSELVVVGKEDGLRALGWVVGRGYSMSCGAPPPPFDKQTLKEERKNLIRPHPKWGHYLNEEDPQHPQERLKDPLGVPRTGMNLNPEHVEHHASVPPVMQSEEKKPELKQHATILSEGEKVIQDERIDVSKEEEKIPWNVFHSH